MKTNVYIDAFNLYFGCLKGTPFKWLDLDKLSRLILPRHTINKIKYFTARVKPRPNDPTQPNRQQIYIRALCTIPNLSVIYGHFLSHNVWLPLANSSGGKTQYVRVIRTEEKGSDVNLATHLLNDAYQNDYEITAIISNDSDLVESVKIVRGQLGLKVGILNPHRHPSRELQAHSDFFKKVRRGVLAVSQFPNTLTDSRGPITKPEAW